MVEVGRGVQVFVKPSYFPRRKTPTQPTMAIPRKVHGEIHLMSFSDADHNNEHNNSGQENADHNIPYNV